MKTGEAVGDRDELSTACDRSCETGSINTSDGGGREAVEDIENRDAFGLVGHDRDIIDGADVGRIVWRDIMNGSRRGVARHAEVDSHPIRAGRENDGALSGAELPQRLAIPVQKGLESFDSGDAGPFPFTGDPGIQSTL